MAAVAASAHRQPSIDIATDELTVKGRAAIKLALRTCYWLAYEELPNAKFRSLLGFLRAREVSASYRKLLLITTCRVFVKKKMYCNVQCW